MQTVEVLQARQETVRTLDLPLNFEWALTAHLDAVVEGLEVRCLVLKPLILRELVLESHR